MDNLLGRKLEHYHIDQLLGEGGMGAVYRAQDINLGRFVALKVMHPHLARRDDFKQRFLIEGQATARMDHSGIAKILAFGQDADQLYMVMEYVAGGSLSDYIFQLRKEGRVVELREMLYLIAQVADALDYAHRRHILHRDLKPDNILLKRLEKPERPNEPPFKTLISDFGLAKLLDEDPFTNVNAVMGTLAYMSPEQALSRPLDGRSDLYSLGVMLYQLATGQLPFNIKSPTDAVLKHRDKMPPPPEQVKPGLPPTVAAIINKSLAKSPRGRYQTGEMLARELRQAAGQLSATDVTHFEAEIPVLSLVTILRPEVESPPPQPSLIRPQQTLPEGQYLIIARKGQLPRPQLMSGSRLTIGRSKTADVVLDDESISRSHARLERVSGGGWRVVDLNSINGTNLDGSKLLPDVAHPWQQGQSLQIGPYYLTWEGSAAATQTIIATRTEIQTAVQSVGATVLRSTIDNLDIIVEPNTVTVDAGGVGEINVKIVNSGAQVGHYHLDVTHLPPDWYSLPESPVRLLPEVGAALSVTLHPPRHPSARSGPHTFRLSVISQQQTAVASTSPVLMINPYRQLALDMQPSQIEDGGSVRLTIRNQGNADVGLRIDGQDPAEALQFRPSDPSVTLTPGSEATIPVQVQAKKPPLIGTTRSIPFDVMVKHGAGSEKRPGQVTVAPRIPPMVIPLLSLLLIICCAASYFANVAIADNNAAKTAEALAAVQTAAAVNASATGQAIAQVEATTIAQTAQAQGDNDGDGLSNNDEINLFGTNPDLADSDGDGLNDGLEINVHNTKPLIADTDGDGLNDGDEIFTYNTRPLNQDSDGDTLSDGAEITGGTEPTNRDTDGDGLPDNQDPDPLINQSSIPTEPVPPTPTPPPSATPSPTSAPPPTSEPTSTATPTITPSATRTSTPTATITPVGITVTEDCIGVNPDALEIRAIDGDWRIVSGGSSILLNFDEKLDEAQTSLAIMEYYRFTEFCFVGRPDSSMQYFLVNNQSPQGSFPGEDCIGFNPDTLEIQLISGDWRIVDSSSILLNFDEKLDEAQTSLAILQFYRFNQQCFVGRPDPSMEYFRR